MSTALLQRDPGAVSAFADALLAGYGARPDLLVGCAALEPAVALALQWMNAQGLLPRPLTIEEVWSGLPPELRCLKNTDRLTDRCLTNVQRGISRCLTRFR